MNVSVRKANVIASYIREIHNIYTRGDFTEPSFYPCLRRLFEALSGDGCTVISAPKKTEAGFPDFIVRRGTEIVGYIEAKPLGADLEREERTEQLQRYRNAFPNLILTNFLQFRLYGNGKLVSTAELCDASDLSGPKPPNVLSKHLKPSSISLANFTTSQCLRFKMLRGWHPCLRRRRNSQETLS